MRARNCKERVVALQDCSMHASFLVCKLQIARDIALCMLYSLYACLRLQGKVVAPSLRYACLRRCVDNALKGCETPSLHQSHPVPGTDHKSLAPCNTPYISFAHHITPSFTDQSISSLLWSLHSGSRRDTPETNCAKVKHHPKLQKPSKTL